jgi:hypothetical protein
MLLYFQVRMSNPRPIVDCQHVRCCRHLVKYTRNEPLLLLACTLKGYSLAHMAAESGSLSTLQLLVQLVEQYAARLCARLQEVLSWSDSGAEVLKNMRCAQQPVGGGAWLPPGGGGGGVPCCQCYTAQW